MNEPLEHVLLVHGLASSRYIMSALDWRLQRDGYRTRNWGYWSLSPGVDAQARKLSRVLNQLTADPEVHRLHLVTHSMGCIMMRRVLSEEISPKIQRWVMLGPPNRGSHVATQLARGLAWLCPPLVDLSDHPESFVNRMNRDLESFQNQLRERGVQVGIIAASHDHMVPLASARLGLEDDFYLATGLHTDILFRARVYQQIKAFLRDGAFEHDLVESQSHV